MLDIQLRLHPREKAFPCDKTKTESPTFFPCYYRVYEYAYNGIKFKAVIYTVHYKYNYAIGMFDLKPESAALGYHVNDLECVMVLHDIATDEPKYVFLSGHAQEGHWFKYEECKVEGNRLVVYSALYSHRHWNKPATLWRMFGFANDNTSDAGRHIDMDMVIDPDINIRVWNQEVLSTSFRAFFLPLYQGVFSKMKTRQIEHEDKLNADVL